MVASAEKKNWENLIPVTTGNAMHSGDTRVRQSSSVKLQLCWPISRSDLFWLRTTFAADVNDASDRADVPTWGTPTIVQGSSSSELVVNGYRHSGGYDPTTGAEL